MCVFLLTTFSNSYSLVPPNHMSFIHIFMSISKPQNAPVKPLSPTEHPSGH